MTRAASRNRRWMQGSLKRKLSRQEHENSHFSADTSYAIEQPLPFDVALTENQIKALVRSKAIRAKIDAERAAKKKVEAENKAWLAQNDWLWGK